MTSKLFLTSKTCLAKNHPNQKVYLKTGIPRNGEVEMEINLEVKMEVEMEVKMDAPILPSTHTRALAPPYN